LQNYIQLKIDKLTKKLKDEYNIELQEVFDALAIGSLVLIFLKLFVLILFGSRLHPLFNIFFLFSIALWAYKYQIIIIVRELYLSFVDNCDPLNLFVNPLELRDTSGDSRTPDFEDFKVAFQSILFTLFVTIRLIIYSEPFIFSFFNFFFGYFLLFNKFFYLSFFYTLILSSSRFVFFISDYNLKRMYTLLKEIDSSGGLKQGNRLKVTYKNILAMIVWIYRSYDYRKYWDRNDLEKIYSYSNKNKFYTYSNLYGCNMYYNTEGELLDSLYKFHNDLETFDKLLVRYETTPQTPYGEPILFDRVNKQNYYSYDVPGFCWVVQQQIYYEIMYFDSIKPNYYFPYVSSFFIFLMMLFYIAIKIDASNIIII
jgi:hypothetical protein